MLPTVTPGSLSLTQDIALTQNVFLAQNVALTQSVYEAVSVHPQLQGNVNVETKGGTVTLRGKVDTYYLKQLAQESIREVVGVEKIENDLTVEWN